HDRRGRAVADRTGHRPSGTRIPASSAATDAIGLPDATTVSVAATRAATAGTTAAVRTKASGHTQTTPGGPPGPPFFIGAPCLRAARPTYPLGALLIRCSRPGSAV